MKILAIAEFDPAGVLGGHRKALRAAGVDYRLAVQDIYPTGREPGIDYQLATCNLDEVAAFAEEADILQFHPSIGQPWSYLTTQPQLIDGSRVPFGNIRWTSERFANHRRISYFHGSRNAAANAGLYADFWRGHGHTLWASTLDYVDWMGATYAPPIVDFKVTQIALLRGDNDPLIIAHAPTDPENCQTPAFMDICRRRGVVVEYISGLPHDETLKRKCRAFAGYDHLRGSFSVNTVENCILGLAPLVGLKREYRARLQEEIGGADEVLEALFPIENSIDLEKQIQLLDDDPETNQQRQHLARGWALHFWDPKVLTEKLIKKYQEVLA